MHLLITLPFQVILDLLIFWILGIWFDVLRRLFLEFFVLLDCEETFGGIKEGLDTLSEGIYDWIAVNVVGDHKTKVGLVGCIEHYEIINEFLLFCTYLGREADLV